MNQSCPKPSKILIINIFGIGDVLFTTPLIANLKNNYPDCSISYLCNSRSKEVLINNTKIDKIFVYDRDEFADLYRQSKIGFLKKIRTFLAQIKQEGFDCVIDLSMNGSISFFCKWIGIKTRIGLNYRNRSRFLSHPVNICGFEGAHVVQNYLNLLKEIEIEPKQVPLELPLSVDDEAFAAAFFVENGLNLNKVVVGLVPGGGASWGKDALYKRWDTQKYAQLADKLIENFSAGIILLGNSEETELCQQVSQSMQGSCISACAKTNVAQFAALAKKCSAVVLNDGGPLHMSVAAGAKTISIFGPVADQVYGPYPNNKHAVVTHKIACRPCYHQFRRAACEHISCLNRIEVEDVLEKVEKVLGSQLRS